MASLSATPQKVSVTKMARGDMGQAFRDSTELQQFILSGVTTTGRVLGTGSYGSVEEVSSLCLLP